MFAILGFLIALLLLVTVHEWGHFWVARRLGVPVVRFSIGMGPAIWQGMWRGVEYRLAWLPLGGYVMFADEKHHHLSPEMARFSFARRSLWVRSAIVLAGPLINLLVAWLFMVVVLMAGLSAPKAWLAPGANGTPWSLVSGDQTWEVLSVNHTVVDSIERLPVLLLRAATERDVIHFELRGWQGEQRIVEVDAQPWRDASWVSPKVQLVRWGTLPATPPVDAVIAEIAPSSPAQRAGLMVGDKILQLNGMRVDSFAELSQWVRANPNAAIHLTVSRQGALQDLALTLGAQLHQDAQLGYLGVRPEMPSDWSERWFTHAHLPFLAALTAAPERLWDLTVLTLQALKRLVFGQSGLEQLAGPIGIAQVAGNSLEMGWVKFVSFLALLSLSLGVLNLLPLPVLDGGHLLLFALEGLRGRPLSDAVMLVWQKIGIVLIVGMTMLAIGSDLQRLFGG